VKFLPLIGLMAASAVASGCGSDFVRDGRTPARLIIVSLQGASGAEPNKLSTVVFSDVITNVTTGGTCSTDSPCPTIFGDPGQVELRLQLRDIGTPTAPNSPSPLNAVTVTRYRVEYTRSDNRNTQGVDVPYSFDGAATFTVPADGAATAGFNLVRHQAKMEAPLAALASGGPIITTIATVTFWGHDQAGNEVMVQGTIDVSFGNFGDPA
jgi:hypothetical protein